MLGRAIATLAFVWLMAPHEPDLGVGCGEIGSPASDCSGVLGQRGAGLAGQIVGRAWESSQFLHEALLLRLDVVRDDIRRHLEQPQPRS